MPLIPGLLTRLIVPTGATDGILVRHRDAKGWFVSLTLSIVLQGALFAVTIAPKESKTMHHFGEDSTYVVEQDKDFLVIFKN